MNVLALTRYHDNGASSRVRFLQYLPYLRSQGIEVTVAPFFPDRYLDGLYASGKRSPAPVMQAYRRRLMRLLRARSFDLIWTQYEIWPWLPAWLEGAAGFLRIPQAIDYDDAVFHSYQRHANPAVRMLLGKKIDSLMKSASLVIAGNSLLARRASEAGAVAVALIPSVVDTGRYHMRPKPQKRDGAFTVGWIGTPLTAKYLTAVAGPLRRFTAHADVNIRLVGAGERAAADMGAEPRIWRPETEVSEIQDFDVGIMPLPDSPFEQGKCGYKLIQYMACGKPVIASPVGANNTIVDPGVNGMLACDEPEWEAALESLRADRSRREQMGSRGRERVEQDYSLARTAPVLARHLRAAAQ